MRRVGLAAQIVGASGKASSLGDGEVLARLDPLLLRLVRDRGQEFLDVAAASSPDQFHQFDDLEIALGWRSLADVLAKTEPEPLHVVLERLRSKLPELKDAFEGERAAGTGKRIEEAARRRGEAFAARVR